MPEAILDSSKTICTHSMGLDGLLWRGEESPRKATSANFNGKGTLGWNIKVNTLTGSSGKGQDQKPKDQQEAQRIHLHSTGLVMNHRCSHSGARGHTKEKEREKKKKGGGRGGKGEEEEEEGEEERRRRRGKG